MFNILAFSIITISLGVILVIIYRKLPLIEQIKVDEIQREKRKKYQILEERLQRNFKKILAQESITKICAFAHSGKGKIKNSYHWIQAKRKAYLTTRKEVVIEPIGAEDKDVPGALEEARARFREGKFNEAEEAAIQIIKGNPKSLGAYKLLVEIYLEKKNFFHAEATQEHLVKLAQRLKQLKATDYLDLAHIKIVLEKAQEGLQEAVKAVRLEPQNPKVLHFLVKLSIACKQKKYAWKYYIKLKKINPENQSLDELLEQVKGI